MMKPYKLVLRSTLILLLFVACHQKDALESEAWVLAFQESVRDGVDLTSEEVKDVVSRMMQLESELDRSLVMGSLDGYVDWEVLGYFVDLFLAESVTSQEKFLEYLGMTTVFLRSAAEVPGAVEWSLPVGLVEPPELMQTEDSRREIVKRWQEYVRENL